MAVAGITLFPIVFGAFENKVNVCCQKSYEHLHVNMFEKSVDGAVTRSFLVRGLRFTSRAGQFGRSVANGSPSLHYFF